MGYAGIFRDANEHFVYAIQGTFRGNFSPLLAKATCLREVLSWIKARNLHDVILESDSKLVVSVLNNF
ncbi:hypothetical protein LguiA_032640 [Lonicera macranthoides]